VPKVRECNSVLSQKQRSYLLVQKINMPRALEVQTNNAGGRDKRFNSRLVATSSLLYRIELGASDKTEVEEQNAAGSAGSSVAGLCRRRYVR
jgi:hypothetical protein